MATVNGNTLTLGPEGDQWHYDRTTRTYDLTRRASDKPLVVKTTEGPPDTKLALAPTRTALVIVDMQNFFLHPSCCDHPTGLAAVEPLLKMIQECRDVGIQIIWLNWGLTEDDLRTLPPSVVRCFSEAMLTPTVSEMPASPPSSGLGVDLGDGKGRTLTAGAWNSQVYGPLQETIDKDIDVQVAKNRISGMWSTEQPLWKALEARPTLRTLLFAGVNTDQCVLGTLTDAYNGGWDCIAIDDCCGTTTRNGQAASMENVAKVYGFVIDSKTFGEGVATYKN